jgi:uncharacterized membrane protein YqaE (UPF0057 family)
MKTKKLWLSKTLWVNLIMAVVAFIPSIKGHVDEESLMSGMAVINILLRFISKDKLVLKEDKDLL